ncbi:hypothetical protein [Corynebacterium striatum]|uniref:hypothetical protein n=1 Tax=Corynebacterium striatum TaxID=43770 RepID=UPI003B5BB1D2
MYTTITLAALAVLFVLIIQTIRRERPEDRMYYAALGGSISAAMILVPSCRFVVVGTGNPRSWYRVSG